MSYDFDKEDEIPDVADSVHEEKDPDVAKGKRIAREKKCHALVGVAVSVKTFDEDMFAENGFITTKPYKSQAEAILERELTGDDDGAAIAAEIDPSSPINVLDKDAKQQRQAAFTDAMQDQDWETKLKEDEGMRVASGFKPKGKAAKPAAEEAAKAEPWYIEEAIERGYIKGDKRQLKETLYQFFIDFKNDTDTVCFRAASEDSSLDTAMQTDGRGKVIFTGTMTYDRRQRAHVREDGQTENASENRVKQLTRQSRERVPIWYGKGFYDKVVQTVVTSPGYVDNAGYNPARGDLLLPERTVDTKHRAEEVAVFIGPLLLELRKAAFDNATAKDIGSSFGFNGPQASAVGNAMLQRALEAATDAYDRIRKRERRKLTYQEWLSEQQDGMPIPARKAKRSFTVNAANDNVASSNVRKEVIGVRRWRTIAA